MLFGGVLGIKNQIPPAYIKVVQGFKAHYTDILQPDDYAFHTIHITVDEDHGGHVGRHSAVPRQSIDDLGAVEHVDDALAGQRADHVPAGCSTE